MTADEKTRERYERFVEAKRRRWSLRTSALAAILSIVIAFVMLCRWYGDEQVLMTLPQTLLAMSLSVGIVIGSRALDGPLRLGDRRRDVPSSSPAAAAVLLWLACFGALEAAFLVADVFGRWQSGAPRCEVGAGGRFTSVQTTSDLPEQRVARVVECEVRGQMGEGQSGSVGHYAAAASKPIESIAEGQKQ